MGYEVLGARCGVRGAGCEVKGERRKDKEPSRQLLLTYPHINKLTGGGERGMGYEVMGFEVAGCEVFSLLLVPEQVRAVDRK